MNTIIFFLIVLVSSICSFFCHAGQQTDTHTYILSANENKLLVIDRKTGKERKMQVAVNPEMFLIHKDKGYVISRSGSMTCIDLNKHSITKTLKIIEDAKSMTIHGEFGYVLHKKFCLLTIINLVTDQIHQNIPVTDNPQSFHIYKDTGYITSPESPLITLIDLVENKVITNLVLGGLVDEFLIRGTHGYALLENQQILDVLDLDRNSVVHRINISRFTYTMVLHDQMLYLLNEEMHTLTPIDLDTHTVFPSLSLNIYPTTMIIDHDTGYVISRRSKSVTVIDLPSLKILKDLSVKDEPETMVIHRGFGYVVNSDTAFRHVPVIDLKSQTLLTTIDNPNYETLAFSDTHIYFGLEKASPLYPDKKLYKSMKASNQLGEYILRYPNGITVGFVPLREHLRGEFSLVESMGQPMLQTFFEDFIDPLDIMATLVTLRRPIHFLKSFAGTQIRELLYLHFFQAAWRRDLETSQKMVRYFIQLNDPLIKALRKDKRFMIGH